MTQLNSLFPKMDPIAERKRVLAKVYRLLLRLAEEAENKSIAPKSTATEKEDAGKTVLAE